MTITKALPAGSYAAGTNNGAAFTIDGERGANIWVDVTNANGGSLVVKLQQQSPGGNWVDVTGAATASIATTGGTLVKIYPGITAAANATVNIVLGGGVYRLVATVTTATMTFSGTVEAIN